MRDESPDATIEALTLLEAQRHTMLMYTSCGWFFNDIAGTRDRAGDALRRTPRICSARLGEGPDLDQILGILDAAMSNDPSEGTGRDIWRRHVEPTAHRARQGSSRTSP